MHPLAAALIVHWHTAVTEEGGKQRNQRGGMYRHYSSVQDFSTAG